MSIACLRLPSLAPTTTLDLDRHTAFHKPHVLSIRHSFDDGIGAIFRLRSSRDFKRKWTGRVHASLTVRAPGFSEHVSESSGTNRSLVDAEISRLRDLLSSLRTARDVAEKSRILRRDSRVRSVFGEFHSPSEGVLSPAKLQRRFIKPAVSVALSEFGPEDLFLLECLIACGQEHVLDVPVGWDDDDEWEDAPSRQSDAEEGSRKVPGSIKDVFGMLASMIEGWELSPDEFPSSSSTSASLLSFKCNDGTSPSLLQSRPGQSLSDNGQVPSIQSINSTSDEPAADLSLMRVGLLGSDGECSGVGEQGENGSDRSVLGRLQRLVSTLRRMEKFYDSIGGIIG